MNDSINVNQEREKERKLIEKFCASLFIRFIETGMAGNQNNKAISAKVGDPFREI